MLQCSFSFIIQEIIIFMTSCKLVYNWYLQGLIPSLYNANIWMSASLWGISGNVRHVKATYITTMTSIQRSCLSHDLLLLSGKQFMSPLHPGHFLECFLTSSTQVSQNILQLSVLYYIFSTYSANFYDICFLCRHPYSTIYFLPL